LIASLLGFFDGDGSHAGNSARMGNMMSKSFLDDICEVFALRHKKTKEHWENGEIKGYYLNLDAEFFNCLLDNYEGSLLRKRRYYTRFTHKFPLTKTQLEKLVNENPMVSGRELALLIYQKTNIKVGKRTVSEKLLKWNIKQIPKDEWLKQTVIKLRKKGLSLREIWLDEERGLGFSKSSWEKNRWRFFTRIFKNDFLIKDKNGSIIEKIEKTYS